MYTDPIADMLNRIRTSQAVSKETVDVPFSAMKEGVAGVLEKFGFVEKVAKKKKDKKEVLSISLSYEEDGSPVITQIKRVSSPGQRIYTKSKDLKKVKGGRGICVVSTPKGIMSNVEARKQGLGGEVICEVW